MPFTVHYYHILNHGGPQEELEKAEKPNFAGEYSIQVLKVSLLERRRYIFMVVILKEVAKDKYQVTVLRSNARSFKRTSVYGYGTKLQA